MFNLAVRDAYDRAMRLAAQERRLAEHADAGLRLCSGESSRPRVGHVLRGQPFSLFPVYVRTDSVSLLPAAPWRQREAGVPPPPSARTVRSRSLLE